MTILAANSVSFSYGDRPVLQSVDAAIRGGELVGLIGPNGAGKTTLLRLMAGLDRPSLGTVRLGEHDLAALSLREKARSIAFLQQGAAVEWDMRVHDVVALGRLPHGLDSSDRAAAIAMQRAGIADLADRRVLSLSGGQRSLVLLARLLATEAPFMLADEPVAALDPSHQLRVMQVLRQCCAQGAGAAVVMHDLSLAARFCDRLILLSGGRVLAAGEAAACLTDEILRAAYGVTVVRGVLDGIPVIAPRAIIAQKP